MDSYPELFRWKVKVYGRVQGVGFRWFVEKQASLLGLTGWVKNCPDETVEAEFEGNLEALKKIHSALSRGPSLSLVQEVQVNETSISERNFKSFSITY